jgi:hypothetical protein
MSGNGAGDRYGVYSTFSGTNTGNKYGVYTTIGNSMSGTNYGIYSRLGDTTNDYAGYFLGRVSLGTTTSNNYILPFSRGTIGQIMQTDNVGNVSWTSASSLNSAWFKENTITSPTSINDDIFTQGNVSIGDNIASYKLDINNLDNARSIFAENKLTTVSSTYGLYNTMSGNGAGDRYGVYATFSGTNTGNKYGFYSTLSSSLSGTNYGVYSTASDTTNDYAGYFVGRVSFGTTPSNNYILPFSRGANGQIMQTDNLGNVSWQNANTVFTDTDNQTIDVFNLNGSSLELSLIDDAQVTQTVDLSSLQDHDFYKEGTTSPPTAITDDIFTQGNVAIGKNTADYKLDIQESSNNSRALNIKMSGNNNNINYGAFVHNAVNGNGINYGIYSKVDGSNDSSQYGLYQIVNGNGNGVHQGVRNQVDGSGTGRHTGVVNVISGSGSGYQYGTNNAISNTGNGQQIASYNQVGVFNVANTGNHFGNFNTLTSIGSGQHYGTANTITGSGIGTKYGVFNSFTKYNNAAPAPNGIMYGIYTSFDPDITGSFSKYGTYSYIPSTVAGTNYGIYSDVENATSYAGYFLGRVSFGTTTLNNYILPSSRGTVNQIMQTDGSGNVTWQNPNTVFTDTDNQTIDVFNLNGTDLELSLIDDAQATQIVDLSSLQDGGALQINDLTDAKSDNDGSQNGSSVFLGLNAGLVDDSSDNRNTSIGFETLKANTTGNNNTALGYNSGFSNITGNANVFLGSNSGYNETGSNKLYIESSNADANNALIYGEFDNNILQINGDIMINDIATATEKAVLMNDNNYSQFTDNNIDFGTGGNDYILATKENINDSAGLHGDGNYNVLWSPGDLSRQLRILDEDKWNDNDGDPYNNAAEVAYIDDAGQYFQASDKNRKHGFKKLTNALSKIDKLNGYTYQYNINEEELKKGEKPTKASGVIAQELYKVLPEAVEKTKYGEYFVNYAGITPLLIEAVKDLKKENESLKKRLDKIEKLLLKK